MFCVGADAQLFPFVFENRYYLYLYGDETGGGMLGNEMHGGKSLNWKMKDAEN